MGNKNYFEEKSFFGSYNLSLKVKKHLHSEKSKWQQIDVYETESVGRLLTLDGKTMVSDADEFVYHEIMGHVSYAVAREHKNILIIGGGDCGIVREFVKHPDIEKIDLVEIDERVVEVSKEYFPYCTTGMNDPRVTLYPEDGIKFIESKKNHYDIIIIDSTDPEEFAEGLFTKEFYNTVSEALTENGIMMAQTENPFLDEYGIGKIYDNLRSAFPIVESLTAPMLIYPGVFWTFSFVSKKYKGTELNPQKSKHMAEVSKNCKWYNTDWHKGAFALSNFHKKMVGIKS